MDRDQATTSRGPSVPCAADVLARVHAAWPAGRAPRVEEVLDQVGPLGPGELGAVLLADQRQRWEAGERLPAEEYLRRLPGEPPDPDAAVDLIFQEYLLRERLGERPELGEYLRRFPAHAGVLRDQLSLHRALAAPDTADASAPPGFASTLTDGRGAAPGGSARPADLPRRFDDYELLGEVARGGMGVVFKARQVSLNRVVALKVLLGDRLGPPEEAQRFRAEAEAAAHLDHPHVLPVYQVGEHDGRPYFAMKLVEGGSLAEALPRLHGNTSAAVALLAKVCRAVHHAHQRGILHRDLKPANVLLDRGGAPYVADFGLAKRVEGDSGLTQTGAILGTPSYMAPEQARGERTLTTAADVYALGAILYHLLTGRPPFRGDSAWATLRLVQEAEPARPRAVDPAADRDLETVALKCLEKEPHRRYGSAEALADELERWLRGEPIRARPVGRPERAWRWCRRNPGLAGLGAAAALLTAALAVGGPLAAVQQGRLRQAAQENEQAARASAAEARRQRDRARAAADQFFVDVSTNKRLLAREPGTQALRRQLLERARGFYQELLAEQKDDPDLRADTARVYLRLAEIERDLKPGAQPLELNDQARRLLEGLLAEAPGSEELTALLGQAWYGRGYNLRFLRRLPEAEQAFLEAIRLRERLAADHPDSGQYASDLATAHNNLGIARDMAGRPADALAAYDQARAIEERLVREHPGNVDYARDLAGLLNNLGTLSLNLRKPTEALGYHRQALQLRERLLRANPSDATLTRDVANSHMNLGILHIQTDHPAQALPHCAEAVQLFERLAAANPSVAEYQFALANLHHMTGAARRAAGAAADAPAAFERATALYERLVRENPRAPAYAVQLAQVYADLGDLRQQGGRAADGLALLEKARDVRAGLAREHPDNPQLAEGLAEADTRLGKAHYQARRFAEAAACYERACAAMAKPGRDPGREKGRRLQLARIHLEVGRAYWRAGKWPEAARAYEQARALGERLVQEHPGDAACAAALGAIDLNRGLLATDEPDPGGALGWFAKAMERIEPLHRGDPKDPEARFNLRAAYWGRADALRQLGRFPEALAAYDAALGVDDGERRVALRAERAAVAARLGRHAEAVAAVEELAPGAARDDENLFRLARALAAAAGAARADASLPEPERLRRADGHAARAVGLLDQARAAGYFRDPLARRRFAADADFEPVRARDDFRQLDRLIRAAGP